MGAVRKSALVLHTLHIGSVQHFSARLWRTRAGLWPRPILAGRTNAIEWLFVLSFRPLLLRAPTHVVHTWKALSKSCSRLKNISLGLGMAKFSFRDCRVFSIFGCVRACTASRWCAVFLTVTFFYSIFAHPHMSYMGHRAESRRLTVHLFNSFR